MKVIHAYRSESLGDDDYLNVLFKFLTPKGTQTQNAAEAGLSQKHVQFLTSMPFKNADSDTLLIPNFFQLNILFMPQEVSPGKNIARLDKISEIVDFGPDHQPFKIDNLIALVTPIDIDLELLIGSEPDFDDRRLILVKYHHNIPRPTTIRFQL